MYFLTFGSELFAQYNVIVLMFNVVVFLMENMKYFMGV